MLNKPQGVVSATEDGRYQTVIDLIDEACASVRMEIDSMPEELDTITRDKNRLEMERISIEKEDSTEDNEYRVSGAAGASVSVENPEVSDAEAVSGVSGDGDDSRQRVPDLQWDSDEKSGLSLL